MEKEFKDYYDDGIPPEILECTPEENERLLALEIEKLKNTKSWDDIDF